MAKKNKKVYAGYKNNFSIEKVSVGYDRFLDKLTNLIEEEISNAWYPPYNIRKTSANEYAIDVEVTGYDKKDIEARLESGALIITAPGKSLFEDPAGDDVYYHQGIFPGGELNAKFYVAEGLTLTEAVYDDGVVTFRFKYVPANNPTLNVPIGPFDKTEITKPYTPVFDSSGRPVGGQEFGAGSVTMFVPEEREEVLTVVNDDTTKKPTVEVVTLDPMPQVVEVSLEGVADSVSKKSEEPQATIVLSDATYEVVSDDVVTEVIKTDDGKSDIVVAIPQEVADAAKDAGINVLDSINKAIEKTEVESPNLPEPYRIDDQPTIPVEISPSNSSETVVVNVPEVVPSVVEAKVIDGEIHLQDVSENVPVTADLIPVITKDGSPDIVVAVTPSTQEHLDDLGIGVATDIGAAIIEAQADVAPAAAAPEPVFETVDTPVIVNGESSEKPTVEVVLPDPLPQIVEVSVDLVAPTVDVESEHPQATITVSEAVHEVSDDVVTEVIKTEDGKSDIVVAVPADVHADLTEKGIDVVEAIKTAVAESSLAAPELPAVQPTDVVTTPIVTDVGTEVEVVAPAVIPQVVEATLEQKPVEFNSAGTPVETSPQVVLTDVSGNIPEGATLVPVVTASGEHDIMVAVTPETQRALDQAGVDVSSDLSSALDVAKTEVVVAEPTLVEEPLNPVVFSQVLNADDPEKPTVEVIVPNPLPQIVEATVERTGDTVDPTSSEPQMTVTLSDATYEVSDNVVTDVIKTEEGKSDTVVAVTQEVHEEAAAENVDILQTVKDAVAESVPAPAELPAPESQVEATPVTVSVDLAPVEPAPSVTVTTPEVIPQVVEAVVTSEEGASPTIELKPVSENIPENAELVPVITKEDQPDVMVAVTPETAEVLDGAGIDVATDVGKALVEGDVEVIKVSEETPVSASETVLNADNTEVPTVAVSLPNPLPQIIEITAPEVPVSLDPASVEPQATLVVSDATHEVSDNVVTEVIKTPDGQSDVVVAVTGETKEALEAAGIDPIETVKAAIEESSVAAPALPAEEGMGPETAIIEVTPEAPAASALEVTVPDTIPQVVEAVLAENHSSDAPAIELKPVSEDIPADATLVPVITKEDQPDVMVAVTPETQAALDAAGVDVAVDVSKALVDGEVEVAKSAEQTS